MFDMGPLLDCRVVPRKGYSQTEYLEIVFSIFYLIRYLFSEAKEGDGSLANWTDHGTVFRPGFMQVIFFTGYEIVLPIPILFDSRTKDSGNSNVHLSCNTIDMILNCFVLTVCRLYNVGRISLLELHVMSPPSATTLSPSTKGLRLDKEHGLEGNNIDIRSSRSASRSKFVFSW